MNRTSSFRVVAASGVLTSALATTAGFIAAQWSGIALVDVIAGAILCLAFVLQPRFALMLLVILSPMDLIYEYRIGPLTPVQALGYLAIGSWLVNKIACRGRLSQAAVQLGILGAVFTLVAVLTTAFNGRVDEGLSRLVTLLQLCVLASFAADVASTSGIRWYVTASLAAGLLLAIATIVSHYTVDPSTVGLRRMVDDTARVSGLARDPNYAAALIAPTLAYILWLLSVTSRARWLALGFGAIAVVVVAILMTGSRWGFIALVLIPLMYYGSLNRWRCALANWNRLLVLIAVSGALVVIVPQLVPEAFVRRLLELGSADVLGDSSIQKHQEFAQAGLHAFISAPLTGIGLSTVGYHNSLVEILAQTGLTGAVLFVFMWLLPVLKLIRPGPVAPSAEAALAGKCKHALVVATAATAVLSLSIGLQYEKSVWILLGVLTAASTTRSSEARRVVRAPRVSGWRIPGSVKGGEVDTEAIRGMRLRLGC